MPGKEKKERGPRTLAAAYLCWLVGFHYLYLGERDRQLIYIATLGGIGTWAIRDLLRMPYLVELYNEGGRLAPPLAPHGPRRWVSYFFRKLRGLPSERWVALDFETASGDRNSVCEVGYAVLERGRIVESGQRRVRPPQNHYAPENIRIHGITPAMTEKEAPFSEVWPQLRAVIGDGNVLMHWSKFDVEVLRASVTAAGLEPVSFRYIDTVALSKMAFPGIPSHRLPRLARVLGIPLQHHSSESDARALALVADRCRKASASVSLSEAAVLLRCDPVEFESRDTRSPLSGDNLHDMELPPAAERPLGTLSDRTAFPGAQLLTDGQKFFLLTPAGRRTGVSRAVVEQLCEGGFVLPTR